MAEHELALLMAASTCSRVGGWCYCIHEQTMVMNDKGIWEVWDSTQDRHEVMTGARKHT